MKHTKIKHEGTGDEMTVDEHASEYDMERACPVFFRTPHGKRETFTIHRGQLIVRNTVQFTGQRPQRMTTVYLFLVDGPDAPDLSCLGGNASSIRQAKRLIDDTLESGTYGYVA